MHEPGSRSKQTSAFMLPEDEAAFGEALAPAIHGLAQWLTHDHRTRTITLHESLPDAMRHDRTQAFLRLLRRDGGTVGPIIQYLHTVVVTADEDVLAATGGRIRATAEQPEGMWPGRLACKWFPEDETDCVRRDFAVLTGLAWKVLQAVTSPHVDTVTGKLARRYRIGSAAEAWALSRPGLPLHDGALQLRIHPRPRPLRDSELTAQHQDLGILPPRLPVRKPDQQHGTGHDQEDQLQARKPTIIPPPDGRRPTRPLMSNA